MQTFKTTLQKGNGPLLDWFAEAWGQGFPGQKPIAELIEKYGNVPIVGITVYRVPLSDALIAVGDAFSEGKLSSGKNALNYDKLFHLYAIVTLANGVSFRIEKREPVTITYNPVIDQGAESMVVPGVQNKGIIVKNFIENSEKDLGQNFFIYSAFNHNCQEFIQSLLKSNGLGNEALTNFIMQDVKSIARELPEFLEPLTNTLTDAESIYRLVSGKGLRDPWSF